MSLRKDGYWDEQYEEELRNFLDNGDYGYVWYGEPLTRRIVARILTEFNSYPSIETSDSINIIDVGCGNAFLLTTLIEKSIELLPKTTVDRLRLSGIDYSANAIELSKKFVESEGKNNQIDLQQCDFLDLDQIQRLYPGTKFDFIVDKGTFDAICLLNGDSIDQVREKYERSVLALSRSGTILIIASCNHSEDELMSVFKQTSGIEDHLYSRLLHRIETPKIKFGGQEGSQVTCLVIKFE